MNALRAALGRGAKGDVGPKGKTGLVGQGQQLDPLVALASVVKLVLTAVMGVRTAGATATLVLTATGAMRTRLVRPGKGGDCGSKVKLVERYRLPY